MASESEPQSSIIRADKPRFLTQVRFEDFDLPPEVLAGLADAGFVYCTPIQAQVLPMSLTGRDVAGQAQTGTGKTAAFLVTIFTRLLRLPDRAGPAQAETKPGPPSALIVAPTRELALQIYHDAEVLGRHTGLTLAQVVGGIDYRKQAEVLRRGADIVICTPGRIIDYFKQGVFKTTGIKALVIDEADRLFDLGFTKDMRYILKKLPHYEKRQSMLFSATLSYRVLELTYDYMNLPEFISVTPEEVTVDGIEQSLIHVGREEKLSLLLGLLDREEWSRVLIFVNTKAGVEWLAAKLRGNGLPAEGITGDIPQPKRLKLMERFKSGRVKILVATDVASRGIHVEDITHVINYDLPQDVENYVHRIGRTARAGKTGRAISLACEEYVFHLEPLEEFLGRRIPVVWPEEDWFKEDRSGPVSIYSRDRRRSGPERPRREVPGKREQRPDRRKAAENNGRPKAARVSKPGGIFGLSPRLKDKEESEAKAEAEIEPRPKKKRRSRRKKKKGPEGSGPQPADE